MDFFEELRERANQKWQGIIASGNFEFGVIATIEALKDMMVGEPMQGGIEHYISHEIPRTAVMTCDSEYNYLLLSMRGHHGTDGGGVYIMAFRSREKLLVPEEPPLDEEE